MPRTLTDEDCDAIVDAFLRRLNQRTSMAPPPTPAPEPVAKVERIAYSGQEVCDLLKISKTSLWRLEKLGRITPIPGLRHKLFARSELDRFLSGTSPTSWDRPRKRVTKP